MSRVSRLRSLTVRGFNPISGHVLAWLPGFALLSYRGRSSGRRYEIPVKVFRHGRDHVVAQMYGPATQGVKNVKAAGGAELRIRRRRIRVADPYVVEDPGRALLPRYVRPMMAALGVDTFVTLTPVDSK